MTVIVWDARIGLLTADMAIMVNDGSVQYGRKLWRLKNGSLYGGAGDGKELSHLRMWLEGEWTGPEPKLNDVEALVIDRKGRVTLYAGSVHPTEEIDGPYAACGSGSACAMVAMDLNCDPVEAVVRAAHRNKDCRLPVQYLPLEGNRSKPYKLKSLRPKLPKRFCGVHKYRS